MDSVEWEASSFRDPGGAVFMRGGRIFRAIHHRSVKDWNYLTATVVFQELQREGLLIPTRPAGIDSQLPPGVLDGCAVVVEHEAVPFVSYPYEWSFEMLRDAALLHLDILERCLPQELILKDSSTYNIQFVGCKPIFIDVLSFTRLDSGEPWVGYNQFCRMFLYPLMLQSYKRVSFQSWLRSELDGLDPIVFSRLMSGRDLLRPGVFTHVYLQAWMQKRLAGARYSVRSEIKKAGLSKDAIANNVRGLRRLLHKLIQKKVDSTWVDYVQMHTYTPIALQQKEGFVRQAVASQRHRLVWDLGCNIGHFSRMVSEHADYVVAIDADPVSIDRLYCSLRKEDRRNILPLTVNLANLSPNQGWDGHERQALQARGKPDLTLCLALIHHMVISSNIPVKSFIGWLAGLGSSLIIEFVSKEDPLVQQVLLNKDDTYDDYNRPFFEDCLAKFFRVENSLALSGGTRFLYYATPATSAGG